MMNIAIAVLLAVATVAGAQEHPSQGRHWELTDSEALWIGRYSNCQYGYYFLLPSGVVAHAEHPPSPHHGFLIKLPDTGVRTEATFGGKAKLLGITKRGNPYLRKLFVHGARAVLLRVKYDTGGFGQWVHRLAARAPRNKVIVAIANKLARIAWVVRSSGNEYQHPPLTAAA